eukprot:scaffold103895_cov51-Phaeocystis_antarctica.AAC.1
MAILPLEVRSTRPPVTAWSRTPGVCHDTFERTVARDAPLVAAVRPFILDEGGRCTWSTRSARLSGA